MSPPTLLLTFGSQFLRTGVTQRCLQTRLKEKKSVAFKASNRAAKGHLNANMGYRKYLTTGVLLVIGMAIA